MATKPDTGLRIGELATRTGLTPDTLRFYEREGLLDRPARTAGGFRVYGIGAIDRLRFIKRGQVLGLSLSEIHELVRLNDRGGRGRCRRVRDLLARQVTEIEARLAELHALRETLSEAMARCDRALDAHTPAACPVIDLERPDGRQGRT